MAEYIIYTQDNKYMDRVAVRKHVPLAGMARQLQEEEDTLIKQHEADKVIAVGLPVVHQQFDKKSMSYESVRV